MQDTYDYRINASTNVEMFHSKDKPTDKSITCVESIRDNPWCYNISNFVLDHTNIYLPHSAYLAVAVISWIEIL